MVMADLYCYFNSGSYCLFHSSAKEMICALCNLTQVYVLNNVAIGCLPVSEKIA